VAVGRAITAKALKALDDGKVKATKVRAQGIEG